MLNKDYLISSPVWTIREFIILRKEIPRTSSDGREKWGEKFLLIILIPIHHCM